LLEEVCYWLKKTNIIKYKNAEFQKNVQILNM
jgi:hypothetical protein